MNFTIEVTNYLNNNNTAIMLYEDGEPYGCLTVNLSENALPSNMAFLDTNNCNEIVKSLEAQVLITSEHVFYQSGFCKYPLYNVSKLLSLPEITIEE